MNGTWVGLVDKSTRSTIGRSLFNTIVLIDSYVFKHHIYFKCHDVGLQTWDVYTMGALSIGYLPRRSDQYSTRFQS